ncbi:hypothetical protein [Gordonia terrae]
MADFSMKLSRTLSVLMPALSIGFTGVTNLLMPLTFQLIGGIEDLGVYTLVTIPYTVSLAIQRMIVSQSLSRGKLPHDVQNLWRMWAGCSVLSVIVSACTTFLLTNALWPFLLGAMIPLALCQDLFRYMFFGQRRAEIAAFSDCIWFVGVFCVFWYVFVGGEQASSLVVSALFLCACCAALGVECIGFGIAQLQSANMAIPRMLPLLSESTVVFGAGQVTQYVVAVVAGAAMIGEYKAVLLLLTPLTMFVNLAQAILLPRLRFDEPKRVMTAGGSLGVAVACVGCSSVALGYLDPLGVLSSVGFATGDVVLATGALLVIAASLSAFLGVYLVRFRVERPAKVWVRIRVLSALSDPVVSIPMALWIGLPGIATGTLCSNSSSLVMIAVANRPTNSMVGRTNDGPVALERG